MSCIDCEYCVFRDVDFEMSYRCVAKSKRGRAIDWSMHKARVVQGENGLELIPYDLEEIKGKMINYITRIQSPSWCPKRTKIKNKSGN